MRHWIIRACAVLLPVSGFAAAPAPQTDQPVKPVTAQAAALPPVRDTGFVYCVNGNISTFNPQLASSGLIVEPLAAQIYDRLLDVDPYTYRLIRNWPPAGQCWITARPTVFICAVIPIFRLLTGLNRPAK